jgi:hypothetical protein
MILQNKHAQPQSEIASFSSRGNSKDVSFVENPHGYINQA